MNATYTADVSTFVPRVPAATGGKGITTSQTPFHIVRVPASPDLAFFGTGPCSFEFWARLAPGANPVPAVLIDCRVGNYGWLLHVRLDANALTFMRRPDDGFDSGVVLTLPTAVEDDAWHHYVLTVAPAAGPVVVYRDGVEAARSAVGIADLPPPEPWAIGGNAFMDVDATNGMLDDVAIYPSVLSAARVAAHYAARTGGYAADVLADAPAAFWSFDEDSGTVVTDVAVPAPTGVVESPYATLVTLPAVRQVLLSDAALVARLEVAPAHLGGGPAIYSEGQVPAEARGDYLVLGPWTEVPDNTMGSGRRWGSELSVTVKLITSSRNTGENMTTVARVIALLNGVRLNVVGYRYAMSVLSVVVDAYTELVSGVVTSHYPAIFRIRVHQP